MYFSHSHMSDYGRAIKADDQVYLSAPRMPRELLIEKNLVKFFMKYIRDLKNDEIQILVDE
jgi:hypothetical protein